MFKKTITTLGLLLFSLSVFGAGLTEEQQKQIIDTLKNYKPFKDIENKNVNNSLILEDCDNTEFPRTNTCLEKKYIKNNNFVMKLRFENNGLFPIQPLRKFISTSENSGYWESSAKKNYIKVWGSKILKEFLGKNLNSFELAKLILVNKKIVLIEIHVDELAELETILKDIRLTSVEYIGNPPAELEEILN